ncbi:MAG TPA: Arc family DNA-binding protein [Xanthomonadales bacterium]|nr:Arc family DNA-binding protein [Xanthomonadales bacterium]
MAAKKSFPLRVSEDVYQAMRRWSDDELRSVNSQIEWVLREALRRNGRLRRADQSIESDEKRS